jgi:Family of unknown function (DUF6650)
MEHPFSDGDHRAKLTYQEISGRLSGVSTAAFGRSGNPPQSERKIIQRLLVFLEYRPVLYEALDLELFAWASDSILGIRNELTKTLQKLGKQSQAIPPLKAMRAACIDYLGRIHYPEPPDKLPWVNYFAWLGELRGIFGFQIAQLSVLYGIDLEGDIVKILPPAKE